MVAFVGAFFVVASSRLVAVINEVVANSIILLVMSILFLMLAGSFHKDEEFYLQKGWRGFFMAVMIVGISIIFLNALGWIDDFIDFMSGRWDSNAVAAIILIIIVILVMVWITNSKPQKKERKETKDEGGEK